MIVRHACMLSAQASHRFAIPFRDLAELSGGSPIRPVQSEDVIRNA
jgi:hypothetical protein